MAGWIQGLKQLKARLLIVFTRLMVFTCCFDVNDVTVQEVEGRELNSPACWRRIRWKRQQKEIC